MATQCQPRFCVDGYLDDRPPKQTRLTWQQQQEQRYNDRLRERWNEDGTRKRRKRTRRSLTNTTVDRLVTLMRSSNLGVRKAPYVRLLGLCNQ